MAPRKEDEVPTRGQELSRLRGAFRAVFRNPDKTLSANGRAALLYLRKFCKWSSTIYTPDNALTMAFLDGRRSVYLEAQRLLNLSDEAILALDQPGDPENGEPEAGKYGD